MKEKRELKKQQDEKLRILIITIITYFVFFLIKEMEFISPYLGIIILILLYMYANFNLRNIFFTSKRTTFKIYAFLLLEVIYLFTGSISILGAILYILLFLVLIFWIRKDEGREEIPRIIKFVQIFIIFKVIFVLSMLIF